MKAEGKKMQEKRALHLAPLVVLLASLWLSFNASVVYAHAELAGAEPAPGAAVAGAPEEIRLTFSEPVVEGSRITLLTADFQSIADVETHLDPQAREQLVATVPELEPGVYTVQWTAVSADGHEISGSYAFSTGVPFTEQTRRPAFLPWWSLLLLSGATLLLVLLLWRRRARPEVSSGQ